MAPSLPLLLKLAAASMAGAAALLSFLGIRRRLLLSSFRIDLLNSLLLLSTSSLQPNGAVKPPSILVTGLRSHGKSALVNTVSRVLAGERGPLIFRAETGPLGRPAAATPLRRRVIKAYVAGLEEEEGEEGTAEVEMIDGAGVSPEAARADVEAEIAGPSGGDVAVDCVILVVRCGAPTKERRAAVRRLADVASAVRERGAS